MANALNHPLDIWYCATRKWGNIQTLHPDGLNALHSDKVWNRRIVRRYGSTKSLGFQGPLVNTLPEANTRSLLTFCKSDHAIFGVVESSSWTNDQINPRLE